MCKVRVTHDVRASELSPGDTAVIDRRVERVYRVEPLNDAIKVEDASGGIHHLSPDRRVTVYEVAP